MFFLQEGRLASRGFQANKIVGVNVLLEEEPISVAPKMEVLQNRPNPFADFTLIEFVLPESEQLSFSIFDQNGKMISRTEMFFEKGENQIKVDGKELPHLGLYFYRIESKENQFSGKMIFMR